MLKMLMLYNPCSGDGRIQGSLSELVDELTRNGYLVTVYPTQGAGDAKSMIETQGHLYDRIVVCGGDGMMHEAINGWIAGHDLPILGYVPSGTVNDFANTHDIPREILPAAKVAAGESWTYLDVGQFNNEYFSYVAAFGVGTSVSYKTPQEKKKRLGPTAYILEALNTVDFAHWENNCETMKISWQDNACEGDFLYGMVSNSRYVAGTDVFTKDLFNWHDGLLEGLFIRRPMNLIELNAIIAGITRSDFSNPLFIQVQSPWFDFECKQAAWTLDGEFGGRHDHVVARAVAKALKMALSQDYIQSEGSSLVRYADVEEGGSAAKRTAEKTESHQRGALRSFWKDPDEYHPIKTEQGAYIMAMQDSLIYHIKAADSSGAVDSSSATNSSENFAAEEKLEKGKTPEQGKEHSPEQGQQHTQEQRQKNTLEKRSENKLASEKERSAGKEKPESMKEEEMSEQVMTEQKRPEQEMPREERPESKKETWPNTKEEEKRMKWMHGNEKPVNTEEKWTDSETKIMPRQREVHLAERKH